MNAFLQQSVFFGAALSLVFYQFGLWVQKKWKIVFLNPFIVTVALLIAFLQLFHIDYDTYYSGAKYLSFLLTPATICLAVPLYEQLAVLKKDSRAILAGILSGVITNAILMLCFALLLRVSHAEYITMLPKSITTPIGMGMSEKMGGYPVITAAVIAITGIFGNLTCVPIMKLFRITEPVAKGVAIGTASHAMGTAKAIEIGEVEGAISGLSIATAGILTVPVMMIFANFH